MIAILALALAGCTCNNCKLLEEELRYARVEAERISQELAEVEAKIPIGPRVARLVLRKRIEGLVLGIGLETLVFVGSDQGVMEGDEFQVFRGTAYVARLRATRVTPRWSSMMVTSRKTDPLPGDTVTNDILIPPSRPGRPH